MGSSESRDLCKSYDFKPLYFPFALHVLIMRMFHAAIYNISSSVMVVPVYYRPLMQSCQTESDDHLSCARVPLCCVC